MCIIHIQGSLRALDDPIIKTRRFNRLRGLIEWILNENPHQVSAVEYGVQSISSPWVFLLIIFEILCTSEFGNPSK